MYERLRKSIVTDLSQNKSVMAESGETAKDKSEDTENMETQMQKTSSHNKQDNHEAVTTSEYCEKLQEWMWQYYCGYMNWQSWIAMSAFSFPPCFPTQGTHVAHGRGTWGADLSTIDPRVWLTGSGQSPYVLAPVPPVQLPPQPPQHQQQQQQLQQQQQQANGNAQQPGREYYIPSPLQRFIAEMVDFFILFFIKATIIISIVHLSGMKDISKFAMHFMVEEIDEDTSMEELQKMMLVALVYRILVCFYEPNRVRVVPATNVTLSASTVRALNKNFSIAFFFPAFITLLFFQHNRTVYDIVAGTIVVKRNRLR
ncbi:hypothetical protein DNTS_001296 [Danionella cerebrum]|uniref:RDD domain-containing protein n=1 Tax=Danionella cerebrum TaxID=2873325 RepID=A0A553Q3P0_9TELE|nr:hypothetical protein DNTS_001296 [Danionella translucida]